MSCMAIGCDSVPAGAFFWVWVGIRLSNAHGVREEGFLNDFLAICYEFRTFTRKSQHMNSQCVCTILAM
jgi:hypothetical protein